MEKGDVSTWMILFVTISVVILLLFAACSDIGRSERHYRIRQDQCEHMCKGHKHIICEKNEGKLIAVCCEGLDEYQLVIKRWND